MTERPILMSGAMVRACLREIDPKTQTRRVVNPQPAESARNPFVGEDGIWRFECAQTLRGPMSNSDDDRRCPYGQPGDVLWVRENGWERPERSAKDMREGADTWEPYYFDADGLDENDSEQFKKWGFKRRPSTHMPRRFCRLTLRIKSVRVERLQDISEDDAKAEGVEVVGTASAGNPLYRMTPHMLLDVEDGEVVDAAEYVGPPQTRKAVRAFESLWQSINARRAPWASNPWVWCVEFERVK